MTLKQIDERLCLFPEYMRYRLDNLHQWPCMQFHTLKTLGLIWMVNNADRLMSYDQWLFQNGHQDLVLWK